jgi:hypothetical protein
MKAILKFKFAAAAVCIWVFFSHAFADQVGNGGGLAEKNISFAYLNLSKYITICLQSRKCEITSDERNLLIQIQDHLGDEGDPSHLLVMKSEAADPDFFVINKIVRLAKTGSKVGDPIYFDTDLLYRKDQGGIHALSLHEAVAHLIHELGHHHGVTDHTALDLLGSKVQIATLWHTQAIDLGRYQPQVEVMVIDFGKRDGFSQLILTDGVQMVDLTPYLKSAIHCPFDQSVLKGVWLHNIHWGPEDWNNATLPHGFLPLRGDFNMTCETSAGSTEVTSYAIEMRLPFVITTDGVVFPQLPGTDGGFRIDGVPDTFRVANCADSSDPICR